MHHEDTLASTGNRRPPANRAIGVGERRAQVVDLVNERGAVRVDDLARRFGCSQMTVHRDLEALHREGSVERVRGGARSVRRAMLETDVSVRRKANGAVKAALAEVALTLIEPGEVVAMDDSTTVAAIGERIAELRPAAVITHSLELIIALGRGGTQAPLEVVGLGGQYVPETDSFLGAATRAQMASLSADVVLVSTTCLRNGTLYHPDEDSASTKTSCIELGERAILVVDSSKIGASGMHVVAGLDRFSDIVIDNNLTPEDREMLAASGASLHLVNAPMPTPVPPAQ